MLKKLARSLRPLPGRRARLLLLLALVPWPGPAAASADAPETGRSGYVAAPALPADPAARPAHGLDLLRILAPARAPGSRTAPTPGALPPRPARLRPEHPAASLDATAPPSSDACSPHCERLPYFATAPPLPR